MRHSIVWSVVGVFALGLTAGSDALAQKKPKTSGTSTPTTAGAFDKLSPGNQKVASALYQAQNGGTTPSATPLTLDEIAAKRRSGQSWSAVFREMKARGLVQDKTLGQTVRKYDTPVHGVVTTAGRVVSRPGSNGTAQGVVDRATGDGHDADVGSSGDGKTSARGAESNGFMSGAAHGSGKGGK